MKIYKLYGHTEKKKKKKTFFVASNQSSHTLVQLEVNHKVTKGHGKES
jgi:hypothetical protein